MQNSQIKTRQIILIKQPTQPPIQLLTQPIRLIKLQTRQIQVTRQQIPQQILIQQILLIRPILQINLMRQIRQIQLITLLTILTQPFNLYQPIQET